MQLSAGMEIDRYQVEGLLGQGGMAIVYKVRHQQLGTTHALKILTISTPSVRKRLLLEGRAQATLRHPNIVPVTDVIDVNGQPGLVMEYVQGPSLAALLAKHALTVEQADELVQGILAGVACAHDQGLVHRDLKPDNILCAIQRGVLVPKVADFGLVKALGDDANLAHTRSGVSMGTPFYMAPEQIRSSKNVDHRADVWSLGVILYEMMCGVRPFVGDDMLALFQQIAEGDYIRPGVRSPELPERMVRAIEGALCVDVNTRIADCPTLLATWTGRVGDGAAKGAWSQTLLEGFSPAPSERPSEVASSTTDPAAFDSPAKAGGPATAGGPGLSASTIDFDAPAPPSAPVRVEPPPSTPTRARLYAAIAGVVAMTGLLGALFASGIVGIIAAGSMWGASPLSSDATPPTGPSVSVQPVLPPAPAIEVAPPPAEPVAVPQVVAQPPASTPNKPTVAAKEAPPVARPAEPVVESPPVAAPPPPDPAPPASPEPAPSRTEWILAGDARRAFLVSDEGVYPPGPVPPGFYRIQLVGSAGPVIVGEVTVAKGESRTLTCSERAARCK